MKTKYFFLIFVILLLGCQQSVEITEEQTIEIVDETPAQIKEEENFDDNLDEALKELDEIEDI